MVFRNHCFIQNWTQDCYYLFAALLITVLSISTLTLCQIKKSSNLQLTKA